MLFHMDGCSQVKDKSQVATFLYRSDAASAAAKVRRVTGYAISARLTRKYWYVRGHKRSCRCGGCPVLRSDGTLKAS